MITEKTKKAEIKILMQYFKIPGSVETLVGLHGSLQAAYAHLGNMFDNRKANKN